MNSFGSTELSVPGRHYKEVGASQGHGLELVEAVLPNLVMFLEVWGGWMESFVLRVDISQQLDKILHAKFHSLGILGDERLEFNPVLGRGKDPSVKGNKALFWGPNATRGAVRKVTFRT